MFNLRKDDKALLFQLLIGAGMAIIIFFAIINIGTFINATVAQDLADQYTGIGTVDDGVNEFQHKAYNTSRNLSGDYDSVIDSLSIAAVVMAITLPLAAVVAIRKFF